MTTTTPATNRKGKPLTVEQVYALARNAGFPAIASPSYPQGLAKMMVAIAMRESALVPTALCDNCFPGIEEYSIGLWQLNMHGDLGRRRLIQFGLKNREELFDPEVNARAAFLTWGGSRKNLHIAWHIDADAKLAYRAKYEENLRKLPTLATMELAYNAAKEGPINA